MAMLISRVPAMMTMTMTMTMVVVVVVVYCMRWWAA
jgi:hypothetical protein